MTDKINTVYKVMWFDNTNDCWSAILKNTGQLYPYKQVVENKKQPLFFFLRLQDAVRFYCEQQLIRMEQLVIGEFSPKDKALAIREIASYTHVPEKLQRHWDELRSTGGVREYSELSTHPFDLSKTFVVNRPLPGSVCCSCAAFDRLTDPELIVSELDSLSEFMPTASQTRLEQIKTKAHEYQIRIDTYYKEMQ